MSIIDPILILLIIFFVFGVLLFFYPDLFNINKKIYETKTEGNTFNSGSSVSHTQEMTKACPNCGNKILNKDNFCSNCGNSV